MRPKFDVFWIFGRTAEGIMGNYSYITEISFIPPHASGREVPPENVPLVRGSASYECKGAFTDHGKQYKTKLTFKIARITTENRNLVNRLRFAESVTIVDASGAKTTIGSKSVRLSVNDEEEIAGTPGGFRGYNITVEWTSPVPYAAQSFI